MQAAAVMENKSHDVINAAYKGYSDGSIDFIGDKAIALTGYHTEVFNSREKKWIDLVLDEDQVTMQQAFRDALKSDKTYMREYRIRHKQGHVVWIREWAQIVCDDDDRIDYVTGIVVDITGQKKIEEEQLKAERLTGKYLIFNLADGEYGTDISKIKEILGMMPITKVPQTPKFVKGVVNLRGKVIPVVDLRLRFGVEAADYTERTCIVVVEIQGVSGIVQIGMLVDSVSEVLHIDGQDIDDTPTFGTKLNTDYILGMAKMEDDVKILLDIDQVLSTEEISALEKSG